MDTKKYSFERVSVQELLPTSPYLNVRIGADLLVFDGADPKEAMLAAHQVIREFHRQIYPSYYEHQQTYSGEDNLPEIPVEKKEQTAQEKIVGDILTTKDLKVLESYKLLAKKYPEIQSAYDAQYKILSSQ